MKKIKVLFLCTGNSCRSQMAEGWARALKEDQIEPYSAGIETHGINPNAVRVMQEKGVDISQNKSQHIDEFKYIIFDFMLCIKDKDSSFQLLLVLLQQVYFHLHDLSIHGL